MEVAIWSVVLTGVYATTLAVATVPEVLVAVGAAVCCAVLAVTARRAAGDRWQPGWRWAAWLLPLAVAVVADTVRLIRRPRGGRVRQIPSVAVEPPARAAFRRAWGTVVLSASPGSVVLDWPADGGPVVLHELGDGRSGLPSRATR